MHGTAKIPIITMALTTIPMPTEIKAFDDLCIMVLERVAGQI